MNQFDSPHIDGPKHSQRIGTDLYKRILDAGIQFQLSNAPVALRRELFDMSEKIAPTMVSFGRNFDEDMALLTEMSTVFDVLCGEVSDYRPLGIQSIPAERSLAPLRQELFVKEAVLRALQAERNKHKAALSSAVDEMKAAEMHTGPTGYQLMSERGEIMYKLSSAQNQLIEVDRRIKSVIFFGADTV